MSKLQQQSTSENSYSLWRWWGRAVFLRFKVQCETLKSSQSSSSSILAEGRTDSELSSLMLLFDIRAIPVPESLKEFIKRNITVQTVSITYSLFWLANDVLRFYTDEVNGTPLSAIIVSTCDRVVPMSTSLVVDWHCCTQQCLIHQHRVISCVNWPFWTTHLYIPNEAYLPRIEGTKLLDSIKVL